MIENLLLTCMQANFIVGRISIHKSLSDTEKTELIREVRAITRRTCSSKNEKL
jgi:hypothetical protein